MEQEGGGPEDVGRGGTGTRQVGRLTLAIRGFHPPWPSCMSLRMSASSRHLTLSPCWKGWPSALTLRCSSAGLPGGEVAGPAHAGPSAPTPPLPSVTSRATPGEAQPGQRATGWASVGPARTEPRQMLPVVEATGCLAHTLEVHLALVAHAVHVGSAVGPGHAGHAPARLHIPATDVRHSAGLPFPSWETAAPPAD